MKKYFIKTLLSCFLFVSMFDSYSQVIFIKEIKQKADTKFYNTKDSTIALPVFLLKNKKVENIINAKIKTDLAQDREISTKSNLHKFLKSLADEGLTDLDYTVTIQKKNVLSFYLGIGWMAAYPSTWDVTYCFNLETGNILTLDSLINSTFKPTFLSLLKQKQTQKISAYKKDLKRQLKEKSVDSETYNLALDNVKGDCWQNYDAKNFKLYKDRIEVIIDCEFPHVMLGYSPENMVTIKLSEIKKYFNKKYLAFFD